MRVGLAACAALFCAAAPLGAQPVSVEDFVDLARDADVVVLGEIHDNPEHHRVQAAIVAALQPAALVFEMIPQSKEDLVNDLRAQGAGREEIGTALEWDAGGWPDFAMYAPILEAAPDAMVFGAGQPAEEVALAVAEGSARAFGPDAPVYGLDVALDPAEQAAREGDQAAAHCDALPEDMLPGMVEAQRFRDAGLADATSWARTISGGQVAVVTGSGHADLARGVPAALAIAHPDVRVLSLGQLETAPDDVSAFDHYMLAPAPDRADPCAAFGDPPME